MGYFGNFAYSDGRWAEQPTSDPYLQIAVHDSDIAAVEYHPSDTTQGLFFLGYEPRHYFDDPDANPPVDVAAQVDGFVGWARAALGVEVSGSALEPLIADPEGAGPEAVFVEETVIRLIELVGLPLPADLQPSDHPTS